MPTEIKQDFKFVNIADRAYSKFVDVNITTVVSDYRPSVGAA